MKTIARADKTGITAEERTKTRYAVAHNGKDVFHYVELFPYLAVATGLPFLVHFGSKVDTFDAFKEYKLSKGTFGLSIRGSVGVGVRELKADSEITRR